MAENLNLQLTVDTSGATTSVGSLKRQLREAQAEVGALADKFGATSQQAVEAAKRAGELKDRIGDAKALTEAFNPDAKFKSLTASLSGVAGGFGAVQGAMALFGAESDNVQKTLLKVQSAMAISQGLQALGESIDSFKQLGAVIRANETFQKLSNSTTAAASVVQKLFTGAVDETAVSFKFLKGAIAATGIGLLLIALGTLVAYWDDIKGAVSGVSVEQGNLNEKTTLNLKTQQDKLEAIDGQTNQLKLQGKSEKEILNIKLLQTTEAIKAAEINVQNAKITKQLQVEAAKRNKDILVGIIGFMSPPITLLLATIDRVGKVFGKDFGLVKGFTGGLANLVFDPKKTSEEGDKTIEAAEKTLSTLKEKKATIQLSLRGIDKTAADNASKLSKEKDAAEIEAQNRIIKLKNDASVKGIKDEYQAKRASIDNQLLEDINQVLLNEKLKAETKKALVIELGNKANAEIGAINDEQNKKQAEKDKELLLKKQADERGIREVAIQEKLAAIDKLIAANDADFEADKERFSAKLDLVNEQQAIELENLDLTEYEKTQIRKKYADERTKITEDETESERKAQEAKMAMQLQYIDFTSQAGVLLGQIAGKSKAVAIAGLLIEKGAAIARIITQMMSVPAILPPGVPNPAFIPARIGGALSIASVIAASAQGIQSINSAASGGGGGAGMPSVSSAAPIIPQTPQAQVTQLNKQSINDMGNQAIKAYVVESDVTSNQQRIESIRQRARFS